MNTKCNRMIAMLTAPELIQQSLHMPRDCRIVGCEWDWPAQCIKFYVRSAAFREINEGEKIPVVVPTIYREVNESGQTEYQWDWRTE